jgi:hypothetical protein
MFPAFNFVLGEASIERWQASSDDRHRNNDTGDPQASSCGEIHGQDSVPQEKSRHTVGATKNSSR